VTDASTFIDRRNRDSRVTGRKDLRSLPAKTARARRGDRRVGFGDGVSRPIELIVKTDSTRLFNLVVF